MSEEKEILETLAGEEYKYGFTSDIDTELLARGLNEEVVRTISAKKGEPDWMTERRLAAYRHWLTLTPPPGRTSRFPRSIFRILSTMRLPSRKNG